MRWRKTIGPSESSPLLQGKVVYVGDWNGDVSAYSATTGRHWWTFHAGGQVKGGAQKVGVSTENPLGLAVAGAAVGFLVGTLIPSTRVEDEKLGDVSDQVTDKAREAGQEALERTKSVAQDAAQSASDTLQERGGSEAQEMASSLRDKATEATQQS